MIFLIARPRTPENITQTTPQCGNSAAPADLQLHGTKQPTLLLGPLTHDVLISVPEGRMLSRMGENVTRFRVDFSLSAPRMDRLLIR